MAPEPPFVAEPGDTREEILAATYRALCEHGYADLTIQRIADEFPKSKSLLYHHYGGKDELLVDFLDELLDQFAASAPGERDSPDPDHAGDHLATVRAMVGHALGDGGDPEFTHAIVELRAQAAHDPAYREHFERSDEFFRARIAAALREASEAGAIGDVDPEAVAATLVTLVNGAMLQRATGDGEALAAVHAEVERYLDSLRAEDGR